MRKWGAVRFWDPSVRFAKGRLLRNEANWVRRGCFCQTNSGLDRGICWIGAFEGSKPVGKTRVLLARRSQSGRYPGSFCQTKLNLMIPGLFCQTNGCRLGHAAQFFAERSRKVARRVRSAKRTQLGVRGSIILRNEAKGRRRANAPSEPKPDPGGRECGFCHTKWR